MAEPRESQDLNLYLAVAVDKVSFESKSANSQNISADKHCLHCTCSGADFHS